MLNFTPIVKIKVNNNLSVTWLPRLNHFCLLHLTNSHVKQGTNHLHALAYDHSSLLPQEYPVTDKE